MPIATTTDRELLPALDEPELIQASSLTLTRITTGIVTLAAAIIAGVGAGSLPTLDNQTDVPVKVAIAAGVYFLVGIAVITVAARMRFIGRKCTPARVR